MPIKKKTGERKNDFINRCIGEEVSAGKKTEQAAAICYAKWEEMSIKELNKVRKLRKSEDFMMVSAFDKVKGEDFTKFGITFDDLMNPKLQAKVEENELELKFAEIPEGYVVRYKYVGPIDEKSRPFCRTMMTEYKDKWFSGEGISRAEIEALNNAPGKADRAGGKPYSVFNWRGGNNCRHIWVRYWFNPITNDVMESPVQPAQKSTKPQ